VRGTVRAAFLTPFLCAGPANAEPLWLDILSTDVYVDDYQGRTLAIRLSPASTAKFGEYTTQRVGCAIDLIVDGRVLVSPVVRQPLLVGSFSISLNGYDVDEVHVLSRALARDGAKVSVNDPPDQTCVGQAP
jgi:hypothetical protein